MAQEPKPIVSKEETFDKLEIRLGRIIDVRRHDNSPRPSYILKIDFGKFGIKQSVGRFTNHQPEELRDKLVFAVLNFEAREIGGEISEVLTLGAQMQKTESGEATISTILGNSKVGSKMF